MKKPGSSGVAFLLLCGALFCQEDSAALRDRVEAGGAIVDIPYRRDAQGRLGSVMRDSDSGARWQPLFGDDFVRSLQSGLGLAGWVALYGQGGGDLLALTDAGFHLGAIGHDTTDVGLRQLLVLPLPATDDGAAKAAVLDRMVAVDELVARGCQGAKVEFAVIAADERAPAPLRERARTALATLSGGEAGARRRLEPGDVVLPPQFDVAVVVDHARLPSMRWLIPFARRSGMLVTASVVARMGAEMDEVQMRSAQGVCDCASEAPFEIVRRFGNLRVDHSVAFVHIDPAQRFPVRFSTQAVGRFEHAGWQGLEVSDAVRRDNPMLAGSLVVEAEWLRAGTPIENGAPDAERAAGLLGDDGVAIRVVVPVDSQLWRQAAAIGLPAARAVLNLRFGDAPHLELRVTAENDGDAERWLERGKALLDGLPKMLASTIPDAAREQPAYGKLLDGAAAGALERQQRDVVLRCAFAPVSADELRGLAMTLLPR